MKYHVPVLLAAAVAANAGGPVESYGLALPSSAVVQGSPAQYDAWEHEWTAQVQQLTVVLQHEESLWDAVQWPDRSDAFRRHAALLCPLSMNGRPRSAIAGGYPFAQWHALRDLESRWLDRHQLLQPNRLSTPAYGIWRHFVAAEIDRYGVAVAEARALADAYAADRPRKQAEIAAYRKAMEQEQQTEHLAAYTADQRARAERARKEKEEAFGDPSGGLEKRLMDGQADQVTLMRTLLENEKQDTQQRGAAQ